MHNVLKSAGLGTVALLSASSAALACSKDGIQATCLCGAAPKVDTSALSLAGAARPAPSAPATSPITRGRPRDTTVVHVINFDFGSTPTGPHVDPTINVGDTVQWQWDTNFHTVSSVAGSAETYDSGIQNSGATFVHTYNQAGVYWYYCAIHGFDNGDGTASGMAAFVTVQNAVTPGQWNVNADGNWHTASNWSGNTVPNGAGQTASFGSVITQSRTVTLDAAATVGDLNFDSANAYLLAGSATLNINSGTVAGSSVNVFSGSHTITAPLHIVSSTFIDVDPAASTLTVTNLQPTTTGWQKTGEGTMVVNVVRTTSQLAVLHGTLSVSVNGTASGTSNVGSLLIAPGVGVFDLNDNDLVVKLTPTATVRDSLVAARNGGAWNGKGLTSSVARNNAQHTTGLGLLTGAEYTSVGGTGTFSGQPYSATDTLVKYTWNGDANLDGRVTFDDYVKIDTGFNTHLTGWLNGDFNYSGAVNFDDYVLIDIAFNQQSGTLGRAIDWISGDDRSRSLRTETGIETAIQHFDQFGAAYGAAFLAAVPEPTCAAAGAMIGALTLRRRRNSR